jgi:putative ubiquitin-RnfH superfamily antitoxin RatB of RatAB toxin-antitoxin module
MLSSSGPSSFVAESGTDADAPQLIHVEVVYARPDEQVLLALEVARGATVGQVIERSGIIDRFPEVGRTPPPVGIFGRRTTLEAEVQEGDRIEIYRPLIANPKEQRHARAKPRGGRKPRRG